MKKVLSILLSVLMLISVFTVPGISVTAAETTASSSADDIDGTVTYNLDAETGVLTFSGSGAMEGYTKTSAIPWYSSRTTITKVVIEEGVTSIGSYVFYNCTNLTSVTIPDSVTTIGDRVFYGCKLLTTVALPNTITTLGERVFQNCSGLTEITLPDALTNVGSTTFNGCSKLASVYVDSLEHYLNITFGNNTASPLYNKGTLYVNNQAVTDLVIPETVTKVNDYAFYNYTALTSVSIPDNVTSIGASAFYGCTNLASISIADSVTSIGLDAFASTSYVNNTANWTSNMLYIGNQLISANTTLSGAVTIKTGTISIAGKAFYNCKSITSVTIPSSVKSMGNNAFYGCSGLTAVYIDDLVNWCNISIGNQNANPVNKAKKLYLNKSLITSLTIPEEVTSIGDFAFLYCTDLTTVTIPQTVKSIGQYAFGYDTALKTINLPEGLESIGQYAFTGCSGLTSVNFPDTLKNVGSYAFENCSGIASVNVSSLETWCNITFGNYSANPVSITKALNVNGQAVTDVVIPEGVTAVSPCAFYGMTTLESVTIPSSVQEIGTYAFYGCTALTNVTIKEGTKLINNYAFQNCTALKEIILPYSVEIIEADVFKGCSALEIIAFYNPEVSIYDTANTISSTAVIYSYMNSNAQSYATVYGREFKDIYSLKFSYTLNDDGTAVITKYLGNETEVLIPYAIEGCIVTTIGANAFENCTTIESIRISGDVANIESSAFNGCTSLKAVYVESLEKWLNITFGNSTANPLYYAGNLYVAGELLESFTTDETILSINAFAFAGCTSLKTVTISEYTEEIGENAFEACSNIYAFAIHHHETIIYDSSKTIDIGGTIYGYMNSNAQAYAMFYNKDFKDLSSLKFTYTLTEDSMVIITGYHGYEEDVRIPYTIEGCPVYKIADKVFMNNTTIKSVSIPDSAIAIGEKAFYNCENLESITIGDSMLTIGNSAFYGCTALNSVYIYNIPTWCGIDFKTLSSNPLYYADNLYLYDELVTDLVIPENGTTIGAYAFWGYDKLTSVTIPDTMTEIGKYAFYNCSSIENVYISSLENWCNISFDNYYSNPAYYSNNLSLNNEAITELAIPETVTVIGDYAFVNCSAITDVNIPASVTAIGQEAFYGCTALACVNTDSIENWCNITFANSTSNPTYYAGNLFANNELVTEVNIKAGTTAINDFAFFHCADIERITIPNTVTAIGEYALHNCTPVVYGYDETFAEEFATSNSLEFVAFGDVNGDGDVSVSDATAIQKHLVKLITLDSNQIAMADVNGDNKLSIKDATYIQMYVAKMIEAFPNK